MASAKELNAATVREALDEVTSATATASYPFTVTLYERFGNAYISWNLDPNYAIGAKDLVQLREDEAFGANFPVTGTSGSVDTGHVWGSGLNGSYWAWNYTTASWRQLVLTPNTSNT